MAMTRLWPRSTRAAASWSIAGLTALVVASTVLNAVLAGGGADNMHVLQASAFLQGRLDLPRPVEDVAVFNGRIFSPYPPAPAVLLVPFVAVFGAAEALPTLVALAMTGWAAWSAYRICARLQVPRASAHLLTVGMLLGTAYWSAVLGSNTVWYFSHVVAVAALLAAVESALRGRAVAAGLFLATAALSRQLTLFAAPLVLALLYDDSLHHGAEPPRRRVFRLLGFAIPLTVLLGGYLVLNAARFTGPLDTGYSYLPLSGFLQERVAAHGLFSLAYVPFNAVYLFLQGFSVRYGGPQQLTPVGMDPFGTSLVAGSPFLLLAVLARARRRTLVAAWMSIALILAGQLLYYNNGFAQTNAQRFTLDVVPLLFVLLCLAVQRARTRLWQAAVVYAVGLNVLALVVVPRLYLLDRITGVAQP